MAKIQVYKWKKGNKENGILATLKEDVDYEKYKARNTLRDIEVIKTKIPTMKTVMKWDYDGYSKTPDGCKVEPDGTCPHGFPSFARIMMGL